MPGSWIDLADIVSDLNKCWATISCSNPKTFITLPFNFVCILLLDEPATSWHTHEETDKDESLLFHRSLTDCFKSSVVEHRDGIIHNANTFCLHDLNEFDRRICSIQHKPKSMDQFAALW